MHGSLNGVKTDEHKRTRLIQPPRPGFAMADSQPHIRIRAARSAAPEHQTDPRAGQPLRGGE